MKSKLTDIEQRYLLLFKLDSLSLYNRVHDRMHEYVEMFALKRDREHFNAIFRNRYERATVRDLSNCPMEIIDGLDQFYNYADKIFWYLKHTEDMPNTVEDELTRRCAKLSNLYDQLALFIDAELGGFETDNAEYLVISDEESASELTSELGIQDEDVFSLDEDTDL